MTDSKNDMIVATIILQERAVTEEPLCPDTSKCLHALLHVTFTEVMGGAPQLAQDKARETKAQKGPICGLDRGPGSHARCPPSTAAEAVLRWWQSPLGRDLWFCGLNKLPGSDCYWSSDQRPRNKGV